MENEREEKETIYIYLFTQPLRHRQDATQGHLFRGAVLLWILSFL